MAATNSPLLSEHAGKNATKESPGTRSHGGEIRRSPKKKVCDQLKTVSNPFNTAHTLTLLCKLNTFMLLPERLKQGDQRLSPR